MTKTKKQRFRCTIDERALDLLLAQTRKAGVAARRKVEVGEVIGALVSAARTDVWNSIREAVRR